jgi:hypothetical protein
MVEDGRQRAVASMLCGAEERGIDRRGGNRSGARGAVTGVQMRGCPTGPRTAAKECLEHVVLAIGSEGAPSGAPTTLNAPS